jgi:hypothetical protein
VIHKIAPRKQFDGRQAERTTKARPNTAMLTEGDFDWETHKKSEFRSHDPRRQELAKAPDNLKLLQV